ncbi:carbohydrate kinase family protein [Candidatus Saccharibacteria bacterium]|nr:carbohydrate kinase family protein [Candidatus Saccharibacteria bacterium]
MAVIASLGSALQDIYLVDHDDFVGTKIGEEAFFSKITVGSKVDIDRLSYQVGGGGTNSAVSFARHGHQAIFIGNIGRDAAGEAVLTVLDREGIDNSFVSYAPRRSTGCSIILLDRRSGERTILTHRGASAIFTNLSEKSLATIRSDWLYITTLHGDFKTLSRFIKSAKESGTKIMFNPGKNEIAEPKKLLALLKDIDILLLNKTEASELVPGTILTELLSHISAYVPTAIITTGSMGAIATNHEETYRFGIYEDVPVRDTTGAGDAFGSGFLAHYAAGKSFRSSLIFGSANSTSVVSKLGAKSGILTGREKLHPMPIQKI